MVPSNLESLVHAPNLVGSLQASIVSGTRKTKTLRYVEEGDWSVPATTLSQDVAVSAEHCESRSSHAVSSR